MQSPAVAVAREECFPIERLPAPLRPRAETLLLKMLDSEALYTLVGGLKPLSTGFSNIQISLKAPDTREANELRQIARALRCGDAIETDLLPLHQIYADARHLDLAVFSRAAVERTVAAHSRFFAAMGVTPGMQPVGIAVLLDRAPSATGNRGMGYLYGYPKYAVDFFCAGLARKKAAPPHDYLSVPTFSGRFAYPVPKNAAARTEDVVLRESCRLVLAEYKRRRGLFIGPGKPGPAELLRDWFHDGNGRYSPEFARYR